MKRLAPLMVLTVAAGAWAAGIEPFANGEATGGISDEEQRVWSQGNEFDEQLAKGDRIYPDTMLTRYVQQVTDKLFPEFRGRIKVHIVKSPVLNAFALPNGSIYINEGLLARFENEAQLATVLGHEGTHFVNRHGFKSEGKVKSAANFALVVNMLGIPIAGNVLAMSSIFGYSRELESEADDKGYQRLAAAGYDVHEAPKIFEHLADEAKISDHKEPFFFADHPKLQQRLENYRKLTAGAPEGGVVAHDEYTGAVTKLRVENLETELSMGHYKQVLLILGKDDMRKEYPAYVQYYLGEAYRLRKEKGDEELCEQAYRAAMADAPEFAPSYRALGVLYLKKGAGNEAGQYFKKYLALAPAAPDRQYVEAYMQAAKQGEAKQGDQK